VFTARYALSPYIKQIRFVFKGLNEDINVFLLADVVAHLRACAVPMTSF
jgi:hypothetical protein